MKKYIVYITEKNTGSITVEADDEDHAVGIANENLADVNWYRTDIQHFEVEEQK